MATFGFACLLAFSLAGQGLVDGLLCYQCGIGANKEDSCEYPPRDGKFIADCHPDSICSKTTPKAWQTSDATGVRTTRGCAARATIHGNVHELGCHTDQRTGAVICYCDSNFCNKASRQDVSFSIFIFTIGLFVNVISCFVQC